MGYWQIERRSALLNASGGILCPDAIRGKEGAALRAAPSLRKSDSNGRTPRERRRLQLFPNLGGLAHAVAQIVQLSPANHAVADHLDFVNGGGMDGKYLFYADAVGDAADRNGLLNTAVLLGNDSTLVDLDALAGALLDLYMYPDGVAHQNRGQLLHLGFGQLLNEIHGNFPPVYRRS